MSTSLLVQEPCIHCEALLWNLKGITIPICGPCARKNIRPGDNDEIFCKGCNEKVRYGNCYGKLCGKCFWQKVFENE